MGNLFQGLVISISWQPLQRHRFHRGRLDPTTIGKLLDTLHVRVPVLTKLIPFARYRQDGF